MVTYISEHLFFPNPVPSWAITAAATEAAAAADVTVTA